MLAVSRAGSQRSAYSRRRSAFEGNCGGWPVLVLSVGRLEIAVARGVAGERRISTSYRGGGGGAAGVPLGDCTSLFGL